MIKDAQVRKKAIDRTLEMGPMPFLRVLHQFSSYRFIVCNYSIMFESFFAHTTMLFLEERDLQARNSGTVKNGDSFDCVNHKRFSVGESLKNWYN